MIRVELSWSNSPIPLEKKINNPEQLISIPVGYIYQDRGGIISGDVDWADIKNKPDLVTLPISSDDINESSNLFFTEQRVLNVINPILGDIESALDIIIGE